jgi:hypothetical protein
MTSITHPATEQIRRATLRDLVRRWAAAAALATLARWLRAKIADTALASQLGPDPEVEVGRWTGARI